MPLCSAAICDTALSKASGPSTIQSLICPRRFICVNIAASIVACIAGFTTSTAAIGATFGKSIPIARATSTVFCIIAAFCVTSGAMFIAASVTKIRRS